jgi:predicted dehydrogenase
VLSVLIIGCGAIAGGYDAGKPQGSKPLSHAGAFRAHGGFGLAACVDPDDAQRNAFVERWDVQTSYADLADVRSSFDIVSICSPTRFHAAHIDAALALRPRLIFAEKPITATLADSVAIVAACAAAAVPLAVNYTRRWAPDIVALRHDIAAGTYGAVRAANAVYNKGVLNNGSHMVDLLHFLLGSLELVAAGQPYWDFWPDDPTIPALLATAGGVSITIGTAHATDYAIFELTLITESGTITMTNGGSRWIIRRRIDSPQFAGYRELGEGSSHPGSYDLAMTAAVAELHAAVMADGPLSSTGESALVAQTLCEDIRMAAIARSGKGTTE